MAKDFPAQFGRSPLYRNPEGTLPLPAAKDIPKAVWTQTRTSLSWRFVQAVTPATHMLPEGWVWEIEWDTPFFDMRPDLRSAEGQTKQGVPIWRIGARLYVEVIATIGSPQSGVSFSAQGQDWMGAFNIGPINGRLPVQTVAGGALTQPQFTTMSPTTDLSDTFFLPPPGQVASVGIFAPPGSSSGGGSGYPIRYWKQRLRFSRFQQGTGATPTLTGDNVGLVVSAAVY